MGGSPHFRHVGPERGVVLVQLRVGVRPEETRIARFRRIGGGREALPRLARPRVRCRSPALPRTAWPRVETCSCSSARCRPSPMPPPMNGSLLPGGAVPSAGQSRAHRIRCRTSTQTSIPRWRSSAACRSRTPRRRPAWPAQPRKRDAGKQADDAAHENRGRCSANPSDLRIVT